MSLSSSSFCSSVSFGRMLLRGSVVLGLTAASAGLAQPASERGGQDRVSGRRAGSAQEVQARILTSLRERFGVTSDEEWTVISERLLKLMELRRTSSGGGGAASGMFGNFRGAPGGGGDSGRSQRGPRSGGSPEGEALQTAIAEKLPEAEIKARLDRLRVTRRAAATKLEQAQEEFRAVLTVRQEAVAVLMGLLP